MATAKKITTRKADPKESQSLQIPNVVLWLVWALYSAVVLYTTSNHEPWRDEAQSWLIARDNSLLGLFQYLPNEGHPPLWYLLLMPFAKLGFAYSTINVIHNLIVIAFAWLLLFKNNINFVLKVALLFSYFFIYEYAVIARNYSIVALILAGIGAMYAKRFEKPLLYALLIFLLFQTNVLAFCTGVGLGAIFFLEMIEEKKWQPKNFVALAIMAVGALAMIVLLLSAGMKSSYSKESTDKWFTVFETFGSAMTLNAANGQLGLAAYVVIVLSFIRKPKALIFILIATAGFLYLALYQFQGTTRHHGFLLIFLLGAFVIAAQYKPWQKLENYKWIDLSGIVVFVALLSFQVLKATDFIGVENEKNFSDAKNAGEFIMKNNLDKYTIVGHTSYAASAVAPYLPIGKPIWYADQKRNGTFVFLDTVFFNNYFKYSADYAPYIVQETFQNKDSVLLLMSMPIQHPEFLKQWQMIYRTTEEPIKRDEIFFIYRRNF
jgi:hypothetical protein